MHWDNKKTLIIEVDVLSDTKLTLKLQGEDKGRLRTLYIFSTNEC